MQYSWEGYKKVLELNELDALSFKDDNSLI